jgi:uncharacterized protein YeaO (DUF488 family)
MHIKLKRIYEGPATTDGCRVLVDRVWPRGISREKARLDLWMKDIAPSSALRRWFGHDPARWAEFVSRYAGELDSRQDLVQDLLDRAAKGSLTLVYAARDQEHNNAKALKDYLEKKT